MHLDGGISPRILNLCIRSDERLAPHPGRFIPGVRAPFTHWMGRWVGPRISLNAVAKTKNPIIALAGNWTPIILEKHGLRVWKNSNGSELVQWRDLVNTVEDTTNCWVHRLKSAETEDVYVWLDEMGCKIKKRASGNKGEHCGEDKKCCMKIQKEWEKTGEQTRSDSLDSITGRTHFDRMKKDHIRADLRILSTS